MKPRLLFIVESGTDVRLIEGLSLHFDVSVFAREIRDGVEVSYSPTCKFRIVRGPAKHAAFARSVFRRLLRQHSKYDAVVVQGYGLAALAANVARQFTGKPTFMLVCSPAEAYYTCRLKFPAGRAYSKREALAIDLLARANALFGQRYIVLSEYLAGVVRSHGARRVDIIPVYGVDTRLFAPSDIPKQQLKARLGVPTDGTLIFFSSRIAPEKDAETLLRAVWRLLDRGHQIWLLHRSGGYRQFLADAERFGIASQVIATDAVHPHRELPLNYQASDVCVQASREEGLGFSPLEALACETPVIASAVGGLRETIVDGQTGWTYPVADDEALARAITQVTAHPEEAHARAQHGREMVRERFESTRIFADVAKVIRATIPDLQSQRQDVSSLAPVEPRRSLKILLATHVLRKGHTAVYRNTCQRAAYFDSRGHRCTVIAPDDFAWVQKFGGRFIPLLFPIAVARWMSLQEEPFDVAMFHSYAGWTVSVLRRFFGKFPRLRIAIMFHGLEPLYYRRLKREVKLSIRYRLLHGGLMQKLLRFSSRNAEMLMCLNSEEADFLEAEAWNPREVSIVSNPGPNACFKIRRTYSDRARRLLFVGQWLPMKGTKYLVEAFTTLSRKHPDLHLYCAGTLADEGDVLASFPKDVVGHVMVHPVVPTDDLPSIILDADIFVFPTLSEGASLALAEAMAGALPIVTTRVGAAPDLLQHEQSVIFVPTANGARLSDAVELLLDNKTLREKLGTSARVAATALDPSIVWRAYWDCVDKLMGWEVEPAAILEQHAAARGAS